jgi:DNA invertase Pin-like site-specific DNA recombinase
VSRPVHEGVVARIRELRVLGAHSSDIAKLCGVCTKTVQVIVRDLPAPRARGTVTEETIAKIREAHFCGVSQKNIATMFRVSIGTVRRYVRELVAVEKEATRTRVRSLFQAGATYGEIIRTVGVCGQTVRNLTRDLPPRRENTGRIGKRATPELLERVQAMYRDGARWVDIQAATGVSFATISRHVKGLPRRRPISAQKESAQ